MRELETPPTHSADRTVLFVNHWTRYARPIYAYIFALLPDANDADEVFQNVSLVLWEKFHEFEEGTSFQAWACRVSYFKVIHFRRERNRQPQPFDDAFFEVIDSLATEKAQERESRFQALADCYAALSDKDRDLVSRRYSPDGTTKRVAEQVGRSVDAIYKAMQRIHAALLECINQRVEREDN